jgi:hypothetical protein
VKVGLVSVSGVIKEESGFAALCEAAFDLGKYAADFVGAGVLEDVDAESHASQGPRHRAEIAFEGVFECGITLPSELVTNQ